jgi:hypothetical protein
VKSPKPSRVEKVLVEQDVIPSDPALTLREWKSKINRLIRKFGPDAVMRTDAGANNVSLEVLVDPKMIQGKKS